MKHINELEATCRGVLMVPKGAFEMEVWRCDTGACFIGWLPTFAPKTKLKFVGVSVWSDVWSDRQHYPEFGGEIGFGAIAKYFDIPRKDAIRLFNIDTRNPNRNTAKAVVRRVRAYIKKHGKKRAKAK